jgi:hypothetical protein
MLMPTRAQLAQYETDGFYIASGLLSPEEVANFRDHARAQLEAEAAPGRRHAEGRQVRQVDAASRCGTAAGDDKYWLRGSATSAWPVGPSGAGARRSTLTPTR